MAMLSGASRATFVYQRVKYEYKNLKLGLGAWDIAGDILTGSF